VSGRRIHVHVDAIAFRGFTPAQRDGIVAGLREDLARLLPDAAAAGAFSANRSLPSLSAGRAPFEPGAATGFGREAARRIAGRLRP
jgi:hypothetical protein